MTDARRILSASVRGKSSSFPTASQSAALEPASRLARGNIELRGMRPGDGKSSFGNLLLSADRGGHVAGECGSAPDPEPDHFSLFVFRHSVRRTCSIIVVIRIHINIRHTHVELRYCTAQKADASVGQPQGFPTSCARRPARVIFRAAEGGALWIQSADARVSGNVPPICILGSALRCRRSERATSIV